MMEVLLSLAAIIAVEVLFNVGVNFAVSLLRNVFGTQRTMPETIKAELSDTDKKMAEETQNLIRSQFGENVSDSIRAMSNMERLQAANRFANDLANLYGLDIQIDVVAQDANQCGYYDWNKGKAVFNVVELWISNDNEEFDAHIQNFFDTIVHELRHAVQRKAVTEPGFWEVDEERRQKWDENFQPGNYVRADVNIRGYMEQPLENDAYTYAAYVMEGVFAK